jgi:hypothetical protein
MGARMKRGPTARVCLFLFAATFTACGADEAGSASCKSSATGSFDGKAQTEFNDASGPAQELYAFDASLLGSKQRNFVYTLRNSASTLSAVPLKIAAVRLVETDSTGAAVAQPSFRCTNAAGLDCGTAAWPELIPLGFDPACAAANATQSATLTVTYDPTLAGGQARKARLELDLAGDPSYFGKPRTVRFEANLGLPTLKCAGVSVIDFGNLGAGKGAKESFKCTSVGSAPVRLDKVELLSASDAPLKVSFNALTVEVGKSWDGAPAVVVPAGESIEFVAELSPLPSADKAGATLRITSNSNAGQIDIQFLANSTGPCLKITPSPVEFGEVAIGAPAERELLLQGCGTEKVEISRIAFKAGTPTDFQVSFATSSFADGQPPSSSAPLTVQPNSTKSVLVRYSPSSLQAETAAVLELDDTSGELRQIGVTASPKQLACPVACIDPILPGATVIPQTLVALSSNCSAAAPGHSIAKYEWSVVQPSGSGATFLPNPKQKLVNLLPNVAGTYTFKLQIYDELGTAACAAATAVLQVVPDNKLHVELTWETPGDSDLSDDQGADLDLHLAHPEAAKVKGQPDLDGNGEPDPWWAQCYDCFWINKSPTWPDLSDADDDPNVDLDDTNGQGPENISMAWPTEKQSYSIGVYYWSDAGKGPSTPRIRVYLDKVLVFDKLGPALNKKDMWCVGNVQWNPQSTNPSADIKPCKGADGAGNLVTANYPAASPAQSWTCPPPD